MRDPRVRALAEQTMGYSLSLKSGEKVLIEAWDGCDDFVVEFIRAAQRLGAYPYVSLQSKEVQRSILLGADETYMNAWYEHEIKRMDDMDAYLAIRKDENVYEYADIPEEKLQMLNKYIGMIHFRQRNFKMKWCVLRYPSASMAQLSRTSTESFEDFFFDTTCIDYKRMNEIACSLNKLCHRTDKVHIVAPDTDLTFSIKNCCQEESYCGIFNRPCGETGMIIVQGTANGTIRYNIPSSYQGTIFSNVSFTLKDGIIIDASSDHVKLMNQILNMDEGARRIGEFALGFNPLITRPMYDTLFDEKMEKSLHFTPGNGRNNPSGIHWDLVQSHAAEMGGGEIWFDDVLIRKDGLFVIDELIPLNPEHLKSEIVGDNV